MSKKPLLAIRPGSARSGALVLLVVLVTPGCSLLLQPSGGPGADADADQDADQDGAGDGDQGDGGDADRDVEPDSEADAEPDSDLDADADGETCPIEEILGSAGVAGPYPAGTSVVVTLDVTWDGAPMAGVGVTLMAEGGLVSVAARPGSSDRVGLTTNDDGELPDVRVTFPLDPWPYETVLRWRSAPMATFVPVAGLGESLSVGAPEVQDTEIGGATGEHLELPRGLLVDEYGKVGEPFDFGIDGGDRTTLESTAFAWGDDWSTLVVSGSAETCFFAASRDFNCYRTRPVSMEDGPDDVNRVVFYDSADAARGLYLAGWGSVESTEGGLYSLALDGTTSELVSVTNMTSLDATPVTNRFQPAAPPGLYFFGLGDLRFYDPAARRQDPNICPSVSAWSDSIAIGDPDLYEERSLFLIDYDPGQDQGTLRRVTVSCEEDTILTDVSSVDESPSLRPGPGAVFGRMLHIVTSRDVRLLVPGGAPDTFETFVLAQAAGDTDLQLIDAALMPVVTFAAHPPGLYVLDGDAEEARVLRIYQDL